MMWMKTRCRETMPENPWRDLEPPSIANSVTARRVDAELPWNFFWARAADRSVLLTLSHAAESAPVAPLPKLRDIEVTLSPPDPTNTQILALKLLDSSQRDIFQTLCRDIIAVATRAESEAEAVSVALMRTWRWHHLLRGGGSSLLSSEEQKGLLGELLVLERFLLPDMGASTAVAAWRGPLGAPKDFEIGRIAIEVKARRAGASPSVAITSEEQLEESSVDVLFLFVVELDEAPEDAVDGLTLRDVADRVREHLFSIDPGAAGVFEALMLAAGLRPEDDYSHFRWMEGLSRVYLVTGEFPRIARSEVRAGIYHVRYAVSLDDCEPFLTSVNALAKALMQMRGSHGS